MAGIEELESKILKAVGEAEKGLSKLQMDLGVVAKKLKEPSVDQAKALAAMKKVYAFMGKYTAVTKIQSSKVFDQLSPKAQAKVVWMDKVMAELLKQADQLKQAQKESKWDPDKKKPMLLKVLKQRVREAPQMPRGVGTLVKTIEKGKDLGGFDGASIGFLPMAIMLWMIWDTITRALKSKPR
ncbi:hypothetical protein [Frigidibacter sp. ROC022]|uniref:hypothetical protein n=1 Tax=Frigidibacter sp. ROC022 TaxID=2971796 RepID=UPI00215AAE0A|nr:hypothetical protein [Frigidibacter sp. ROC022]MCR8725922.1 hypothetical protein [Frigidibacter sp. ROC022]